MDLAALEEIKRLKYRYLRCVDTKNWDELADALTADAVADYGTPAYGEPLSFTGRDAILGFLRDTLGPDIITTHFASQPEIDIDGDRASGTWAFQDTVIATTHRMVVAGAAFYEDTYLRGEDGQWRIARTGYQRTYEAIHSLDDLPSFRLTANRWTPTPT
ncbi:nuclear transport factor 2 family protein [Amycolatopsis magusensis]|uniref:nuclear transport factor 2 family protein n=1 Tax=Amycolatopsis magusensis TaxID=882444 RepID=UPI003C2CD89A